MVLRLAPAAAFVGFALAAAVLQVLATLVLGLARAGAVAAAADEGSGYYILGAFGASLGMVALVALRRRPVVAAGVCAVWLGGLLLALAPRTSTLGMALHGEYVLHHFATFVAAAACISLALRWVRDEQGRARLLAAGAVTAGAVGMLCVHLLAQPGIAIRVPQQLADGMTLVALLSPAVALACFWTRTDPPRLRWASAALMIPLALRVGLAFPEGLSGGSVPDPRQFLLMTTVVGAAGFTYWAYRPRLQPLMRILVMALAGLATVLMYVIYRKGFGELEDGIGGLAQSLFGFTLPYPTYVADWKIVAVTVALFFMFSTVYGGLMSIDGRLRGMALALLAVTGIGVSNPQLVLMAVAGHLLWIDTLVHDPDAAPAAGPEQPVETILADAATRLDLPEPVVLETARGSVVAVRGDRDGMAVELRARPGRGGTWTVHLRVGVIGRGRPEVELVPDPSEAGERPTHAIGRSHRILGSARALETLGDSPLDILARFPGSQAGFHGAGSEVDFGSDLRELDGATLDALVRALERVGEA